MAVHNIFFVAESKSNKLQVLQGHNIFKGQVCSWKYMRPDIHRWGFFKIIPMRSKSEAVTRLDRIKRDTGLENEIFVENSHK